MSAPSTVRNTCCSSTQSTSIASNTEAIHRAHERRLPVHQTRRHVNDTCRQAAKDAGHIARHQRASSLERQPLPMSSIVRIPMSTTHGDERPRTPVKSQGSRFPASSMRLEQQLLPVGSIVRIPMSLLFMILEASHGEGIRSIHFRYVFRLAPS